MQPSALSPTCPFPRLNTVLLLTFNGSSTTSPLLSLAASAVQPGPSLTRNATSRYLYKQCLSRFDGRHSIAHAGTHHNCTRVLDLENVALNCVLAFDIAEPLSSNMFCHSSRIRKLNVIDHLRSSRTLHFALSSMTLTSTSSTTSRSTIPTSPNLTTTTSTTFTLKNLTSK